MALAVLPVDSAVLVAGPLLRKLAYETGEDFAAVTVTSQI
jgi:hypothetical protein